MFKINNHKYRRAFSLIELSIVILIIGILVAGVTQSSRLVSAMRMQSLRSITLSSPVNSISGLVSWYETVLEKSFDASQTSNGSEISVWYDVNIQATSPNNATQSNPSRRPRYSTSWALPLVNFNGAIDGQFLSLPDNTIPSGDSAFTIFMVLRLSQDAQINRNHDFLVAGYWSNPTNLMRLFNGPSGTFLFYNLTGGGASTAYWPNTPYFPINTMTIITASYKNTNPKLVTSHINGTLQASASVADPRLTNTNYTMIGGNAWANSEYFRGDIGEIIIFNRYLSNDERIDVEKYLAKKFSIKIS